jgi:hypothetical protein
LPRLSAIKSISRLSILRWFAAGWLLAAVSAAAAPADSLFTHYLKGINAETWRGRFGYQKLFGASTGITFIENLTSSRLEISPGEDKWKDHNQLALMISRALGPGLSLNLNGSSEIYSDKQSGYVNDIQTHTAGIGGAWQTKWFRLPVAVAYKEDHRFGFTDRGIHYKAGLEAGDLKLGETVSQFYSGYEADELDRRRNNNLSVAYRISRVFQPGTYDTLQLSLNQLRRDYYISHSGDIESREEKGRSAYNVLSYRLAKGLTFQVQGSIRSHTLSIRAVEPVESSRRERHDLNTAGGFRLAYGGRDLRSRLLFSYEKEDQKYIRDDDEGTPSSPYSGSSFLIAPDNVFSISTLAYHLGWRFLPRDSLNLYTTLQRFRYDTPDPENYDDRDELRFRVVLQETHSFSPQLSLRLYASAHFIHFVYIYGQRSADNNWNRILRFAPTLEWQPFHWLRFSQTSEVLANYVDYDFEAEFINTRSFLYRKFRLEDSTRVAVTRNFDLNLHYRLELDENGKFIWDEWVEQRLTDKQSHTFSVSLEYRPLLRLSIMPGIQLFDRRGYRYNPSLEGGKDLYTHFRSTGPFIRIWYRSRRVRAYLSASSIATTRLESSKQLLSRIDLRLSWLF